MHSAFFALSVSFPLVGFVTVFATIDSRYDAKIHSRVVIGIIQLVFVLLRHTHHTNFTRLRHYSVSRPATFREMSGFLCVTVAADSSLASSLLTITRVVDFTALYFG